jgi:hypothetical protein
MISCRAVSGAAGDDTFPPDIKPMLEHVAILLEMMRACIHVRPDLAAQLRDAWSAWSVRNASVQETLAKLRQDATAENSKEDAPQPYLSVVSRSEAARILNAYKASRITLRDQVEEQAQLGNMKFVSNCDEVLAKMSSGRLDYRPPGK